MSENGVNPEAEPDTAKGGFKSPEVFKVPTLLKASPSITKQKSKPTEPEKKDDSAKKDGKCEKVDERKKISFQPKSNALPSQVYKPHQPSAGEYLVRQLKSNQKEKEAEKVHESKSEKPVEKTEKKNEKNSQTKPKKPTPKLEYTVPSWSCIPDAESYSLEVLKTGAIINNSELKGKEYFVFGRLPECDFMLEHPSISRHHAVLQFGKPSENDNVELQKDGSAGFYIIDLGSTHGTFLNKTKIPSHKYYRVKVGHMIKFGGSSRMHFLQGPSEDEEKEAEETATELREKNRLKKLEAEKKDLAKMMLGDDDSDEDDLEDEEHQTRIADQDTGITWGMLEDAVEEEEEEEEETSKEPSASDDPFSMLQEKKDPFYVKDPNKALKNFYEKEGIELNFDCTERRPGQWTARLEMPVDTPSGKPIFAEASVTGKRRDAVNNCALEACRILDKHGMFRQSEGHQRKVKQWEKDDFYDSDEDGYLDRTGDLDTKRQQRKHRIGQGKKKKTGGDKMETYESLNEQIAQLEKEILQIEKQLEKDKQATKSKEMGEDPLEAFMQQVKAGKTLDSLTRTKLKQKLFNMKKESGRLCKLAAIARPASLPALNNSVSKSMAFIGRMKGKRKGKLVVNTELPPPTRRRIEENKEVEVEEEEEEEQENERNKEKPPQEILEETKTISPLRQDNTPVEMASPTKTKGDMKTDNPEVTHTIPTETPKPDPLITKEKSPKRPEISTESEKKSKIRTFGPTLPDSLKRELMGDNVTEPPQNADEEDNEGKPRRRKRNRKKNPAPQTTVCSDDPNFADWLPPQGQTGDGTTSLNAKFGY